MIKICFMYQRENWSLTLKVEHKLWVIYNKISVKIFETDWDRVIEG